MLKKCTLCKKDKNKTEFYKKRNSFDSRCKSCVAIQRQSRYKKSIKTKRELIQFDEFKVVFVNKPNKARLAAAFQPLIDGIYEDANKNWSDIRTGVSP